MISRREFILQVGSAGAGAIIAPRVYRSCRDHILNANHPLLVPPPESSDVLYANSVWGNRDYELLLNGFGETMPIPSWREYLQENEPWALKWTSRELEEHYGIMLNQLDEGVDEALVTVQWEQWESPSAMAYQYLDGLDLGPLNDPEGEPIGIIDFFEGDMPGDNRLRVEAADNMTLSCLQERLNQLGQKVRIEVVP